MCSVSGTDATKAEAAPQKYSGCTAFVATDAGMLHCNMVLCKDFSKTFGINILTCLFAGAENPAPQRAEAGFRGGAATGAGPRRRFGEFWNVKQS
jgi:hypothetical protein